MKGALDRLIGTLFLKSGFSVPRNASIAGLSAG
jgi:hypothetical protein